MKQCYPANETANNQVIVHIFSRRTVILCFKRLSSQFFSVPNLLKIKNFLLWNPTRVFENRPCSGFWRAQCTETTVLFDLIAAHNSISCSCRHNSTPYSDDENWLIRLLAGMKVNAPANNIFAISLTQFKMSTMKGHVLVCQFRLKKQD